MVIPVGRGIISPLAWVHPSGSSAEGSGTRPPLPGSAIAKACADRSPRSRHYHRRRQERECPALLSVARAPTAGEAGCHQAGCDARHGTAVPIWWLGTPAWTTGYRLFACQKLSTIQRPVSSHSVLGPDGPKYRQTAVGQHVGVRPVWTPH